MQPSKKQIEAAARLVPEHVDVGRFCFCEQGDMLREGDNRTKSLCDKPFKQNPHWVVGSVCKNASAVGMCGHHKECHSIRVVRKQTRDFWQPWVDTEAGRSDALVLLAAVLKWFRAMDSVDYMKWPRAAFDVELLLQEMGDKENLFEVQAATFAAAAAIGAHIGEEGK